MNTIPQQPTTAEVLSVAGKLLVASTSQPGLWYEVQPDACPCLGFIYRRTCRHLAAIEVELAARATMPTCQRCGWQTFELCADWWCGPCCAQNPKHEEVV